MDTARSVAPAWGEPIGPECETVVAVSNSNGSVQHVSKPHDAARLSTSGLLAARRVAGGRRRGGGHGGSPLSHHLSTRLDHYDAKHTSSKRIAAPVSVHTDRYTAILVRLSVAAAGYFFGISTASMTWITPLEHAMSALITLAPSTVTPLLPSTWTVEPPAVAGSSTLPETSAAITLPGRT